MKVLQINSVCGIGSTGKIVMDIHNLLIEHNYESYIAYGRDLSKNCNNIIRIGNKIDNYIHAVKTRIFDLHGFGSKKATITFIEEVIKVDPDIIHLHNIHGYYINIEVLFNYLKEAKKPVIWTLHDCWSFTGHCSHFDYIGCEKWKNGCFNCPQKKEYPKSLLLDNSKWNYKKKRELFTGIKELIIVTPSEWLANIVKQSFLNKYSTKIINNGIDLNVFKPIRSNFRKKYNIKNKFVILGVANIWNKSKGYDYFIELSKRLSKDEVIVMVGVLESQKYKLPDNIIGITRTNDNKELAEIYTAADVFVNPTLQETMGLVNVEALACGTPVITFNTGGSPECIDDSCGVVVEKGNINELIKAINQIKSNMPNKIYCINRAEKYDKNTRFNEYIDLYESLRFCINKVKGLRE